MFCPRLSCSLSLPPAHFNSVFDFSDSELDDATRAELHSLRDRCLGPRETRTPTEVKFERSPRATKVHDGRCYSCGLNTQKPRNLAGPSAGGKIYGEHDKLDDHQRLRRDVVKVRLMSFLDVTRKLTWCSDMRWHHS